MSTGIELTPGVRAATDVLGGLLGNAEPIVALREATAHLDADEEASALLKRLVDADADVRRRQAEGTLTSEDIDRTRAARLAASSDPSIQGFVEAQQAAAAYLPEVNALISKLLGWDFAAMAAASASC